MIYWSKNRLGQLDTEFGRTCHVIGHDHANQLPVFVPQGIQPVDFAANPG